MKQKQFFVIAFEADCKTDLDRITELMEAGLEEIRQRAKLESPRYDEVDWEVYPIEEDSFDINESLNGIPETLDLPNIDIPE